MKKFKTHQSQFIWALSWRKLGQGNNMIIVKPAFLKNSVFYMFFVHKKTKRYEHLSILKPAFSNSSRLRSVFETLYRSDGIDNAGFSNFFGAVWTGEPFFIMTVFLTLRSIKH